MDREEQARLLAQLHALKVNLPEGTSVSEQHVREFHELLRRLSKVSGRDLNDFHVRDSAFYHFWLGAGEPGEPTDNEILDDSIPLVSDARYCARSTFLQQIDGVLIFLSDEPAGPRNRIGFT